MYPIRFSIKRKQEIVRSSKNAGMLMMIEIRLISIGSLKWRLYIVQ